MTVVLSRLKKSFRLQIILEVAQCVQNGLRYKATYCEATGCSAMYMPGLRVKRYLRK